MPIVSLSVERFRNLEPLDAAFSPQLNIFSGENAAGKTSILESLYVLARARSFRTNNLDKAVRQGTDGFHLVARVQKAAGSEIPVGLSWRSGKMTAKINRTPVKRLSELACLFPVQWVGGNIHRLIEEGPVQRRQYLDWGLFHVKPGYIQVWKRYHKLLKQRNAALRASRSIDELNVWNSELAIAGTDLHNMRKPYVNELVGDVAQFMVDLSGSQDRPVIQYRKGWKSGVSLKEMLDSGLEKDRELGYTRAGPHRADLLFLVNDRPVIENYSRGQQKLFVIALQIAQAQLLKATHNENSLFLLDDLGAELDIANQQRVMKMLYQFEAQVFITSIQDIDVSDWEQQNIRRFHVKHGEVSNVV